MPWDVAYPGEEQPEQTQELATFGRADPVHRNINFCLGASSSCPGASVRLHLFSLVVKSICQLCLLLRPPELPVVHYLTVAGV